MNRVSPEIAKEIFMLFEDRHSYSLSREQVAEHHACRTTTHNATRCLKCACHSRCLRNTHCIGQQVSESGGMRIAHHKSPFQGRIRDLDGNANWMNDLACL